MTEKEILVSNGFSDKEIDEWELWLSLTSSQEVPLDYIKVETNYYRCLGYDLTCYFLKDKSKIVYRRPTILTS